MTDFFYNIWARFLTWFGKVKIMTFHWIPVLATDIHSFYVTGDDVLNIMELIQPGDVLIRGYDCYLDGKFIPDDHGYSHAGLYVGEQKVIHATAPSVNVTNIVDFCQCDRIMVLRPIYGMENAISTAKKSIGIPYDFDYDSDEAKLYCFELVSKCYAFAELDTYVVKKFFGLVKRQCVLAKSFYTSTFFSKVYEKNDKE